MINQLFIMNIIATQVFYNIGNFSCEIFFSYCPVHGYSGPSISKTDSSRILPALSIFLTSQPLIFQARRRKRKKWYLYESAFFFPPLLVFLPTPHRVFLPAYPAIVQRQTTLRRGIETRVRSDSLSRHSRQTQHLHRTSAHWPPSSPFLPIEFCWISNTTRFLFDTISWKKLYIFENGRDYHILFLKRILCFQGINFFYIELFTNILPILQRKWRRIFYGIISIV